MLRSSKLALLISLTAVVATADGEELAGDVGPTDAQVTLLGWLDSFDIPGEYFIDQRGRLWITDLEASVSADLQYLVAVLDIIHGYGVELDIESVALATGKELIEFDREELFEIIEMSSRERTTALPEIIKGKR
jgi:hypothetical protein